MAEKMMTQKQALAMAMEQMERVGEMECVKVLGKMLEQKSKVRERKVKPEVEAFRAATLSVLQGAEGPMTCKMVAETMEVSCQKAAAALRFLVEGGLATKAEGEKKSDPAVYMAVQ